MKKFYNIGFIDNPNFTKKNYPKYYSIWHSMIKRCYCNNSLRDSPTYMDCFVDERFHNFKFFVEWCEKNYIDGFYLDKDILIKGNKIYGPDTCCFVPVEINNLFLLTNKKRGKYPVGVTLHGKNYRAQVKMYGKSKNFGTYKTIEEAFENYKLNKLKYICELANKWKDKINNNVYDALINYKIEITD
jgi:hypothetical protein